MFNDAGTTLTNCTVSGNTANGSGSGRYSYGGKGGGLLIRWARPR